VVVHKVQCVCLLLWVFASSCILNKINKRSYRPGVARRYAPPPADGSSTRGGSTSVRGRIRSPHVAKLQAASVPVAYGRLRHGTDRRTDRGIHQNVYIRGHNKRIVTTQRTVDLYETSYIVTRANELIFRSRDARRSSTVHTNEKMLS